MKIFSVLLIIVFSFIINIGLYYTSENYRNFLKNIKQDKIVEEVNDEYIIEKSEITKKDNLENELSEKVIEKKDIFDDKKVGKVILNKEDTKEKIKLSQNFKDFLKKFSRYNLVELKSHSSLMDVTSEYPDDYFEFYNPDLTLYYFPTKSYKEIKEIFEIESDGDFFTINEVNNFGDNSFYINLGKDFEDDFIRFIFTKNGDSIGIKVSKKEYKTIKNIIK